MDTNGFMPPTYFHRIGAQMRQETDIQNVPARVYTKHVRITSLTPPTSGILGKDYGEAMQKWAAMLQRWLVGCIGAVMDAYIIEQRPARKPCTKKNYLTSIAVLRPVFGEMWPQDVEQKHIYTFMRQRNAPCAPTAVIVKLVFARMIMFMLLFCALNLLSYVRL